MKEIYLPAWLPDWLVFVIASLLAVLGILKDGEGGDLNK